MSVSRITSVTSRERIEQRYVAESKRKYYVEVEAEGINDQFNLDIPGKMRSTCFIVY